MVKFIWWSEHDRLCASGVLTEVIGHFKGLKDHPPEIRLRFIFASRVACGELSNIQKYYKPRTACPQCNQITHYFTDGDKSHAWFDTLESEKWNTHTCMGVAETKCSPEWMNSTEGETHILEREAEQLKREEEKFQQKIISEKRNRLRTIQQMSGLTTNSKCSKCNGDVYEFRNTNGEVKLYDSLFPNWSVHDCIVSEDPEQNDTGVKGKIEGLKKTYESTGQSRLSSEMRSPRTSRVRVRKVARRLQPIEFRKKEYTPDYSLHFVLCKVLVTTTDRNGYRLRLTPVPLPRVDMVVFSELKASDIEGVKFAYLNDQKLIFLSKNSLEPMQATVEYLDVRKK